MTHFISENFWIIFGLMSIIVFGYLYYDAFGADKRKPIYKLDENGYIKFYYRRFSCWEYFPIWVDESEEREVQVFDRVRNIDYTLSYVGPGRAKLKLNFECEPVSQKYITDYMRKLYPEFQNSEQLWQLYNLYINKENTILNKVVKNHIFKAHKSNI